MDLDSAFWLGLLSSREFWIFCAVGFLAQLIDGALGMAYGVVCIGVLSALGVPPAAASAVVHAAEVFTTGTAAASHTAHRNIDRTLFLRLAPAGVLGGVLGAYVLTSAPKEIVAPLLAGYLGLVGTYLLVRAYRRLQLGNPQSRWAAPLGAVGGFLDSWGGGWGPIVASTLMSGGHTPRRVVGTVSAAEFFLTTAISATFLAALIRGDLPLDLKTYLVEVVGLVAGGVAAAPLAGLVARVAPARQMTVAVGVLVLALAGWQAYRALV